MLASRHVALGMLAVLAVAIADRASAQTTPLPPGQIVIGPIGNTGGPALPSITTGADANVYTGSVEGGFIPNAPATVVRTSVATQYARFFNANNDATLGPAVGPWIATTNSVRGLTAAQVKNILALPDLPNAVTLVRVPAGTCVLAGPGNPALGNFPANPPAVPTPGPWGAAGAPQYYIVGQTSTPDCINPQNIADSNYIIAASLGTYALAYVPNAGTGNTAAVAAALDHAIFPAPFTPMDSVYNSLDLLNFTDTTGFRNALSQLSGEINADLPSVTIAASRAFMRMLNGHLDDSSASAPADGRGLRVWLQTSGVGANVAGSSGTHDLGLDLVTVLGGVEMQLAPELVLGGALGYTRATYATDGLAGSGDANAYTGALYGRYAAGPIFANGILGYGVTDFGVGRTIAFADQFGVTSTNTNSRNLLGSVEAGYRFRIAPGTAIAPVGGLQVISLWQNSFAEYGAGALDLNAGGKSLTAVRSLLGVDVAQSVAVTRSMGLDADLRISWAHDFLGTDRGLSQSFQELPSAAFRVQGARFARDAAVLGLGVSTTGPIRGFLRYDGEYSGAQTAHSGTIGVAAKF